MEIDLDEDAEQSALVIRYEGGDAANHQLELSQLGESLQGFAKVFGIAANFVATGKSSQHFDALQVRILAVPAKEHKCFEVWVVAKQILASKDFWVGTAAVVLGPIVAYILSKRTKDEMKHLSEALGKALTGNHDMQIQMLATIERLAVSANPSVRKALTPIDRSCQQIEVRSGDALIQTMDSETKIAFAVSTSKVADHSKQFAGVISEFDMTNGTCKVQFEGMDERVPARVVDPVYSDPNNPYVEAMAAKVPIKFLAKYELDDGGALSKLHIFDTAQD